VKQVFDVHVTQVGATVVPGVTTGHPFKNKNFTMATLRLTIPSSPKSFWRKTKWLSSPTHRNRLIWHPVIASYFQKGN
jgi:hypothetical protein